MCLKWYVDVLCKNMTNSSYLALKIIKPLFTKFKFYLHCYCLLTIYHKLHVSLNLCTETKLWDQWDRSVVTESNPQIACKGGRREPTPQVVIWPPQACVNVPFSHTSHTHTYTQWKKILNCQCDRVKRWGLWQLLSHNGQVTSYKQC